jgi:DNA topoisomerase-1
VFPEAAIKDNPLPELKQDMQLKLSKLIPEQHFTQPPARYTEASLIKALEEFGIGRPSTYAAIIGTLYERKYIERTEGKLAPSDLGETVEKLLIDAFPDVFNVDFTAHMEEDLDQIEQGDLNWIEVVKSFYDPFSDTLEKVNDNRAELKKSLTQELEQKCPDCGKPLLVRWGKTGKFIGCSGYPDCRYTDSFGKEKEEIEKLQERYKDSVCEACGSKMVPKRSKNGYFLGCSNFPDCKNVRSIVMGTGVTCPKCNEGEIIERNTRRGKLFFGCNKYPKCDYSSWSKPINRACPHCNNPYIVESKKGLVCPECKQSPDSEE